ncbi:MAG: metalloregulator ArsR/SmtB family transcription factor [Zavarzinella sp.]
MEPQLPINELPKLGGPEAEVCPSGVHSHDRLRHVVCDLRQIERAAGMFRAMGDPARMHILVLLMDQECCVSELVEHLGEKNSTISQRLKILHTEGLLRRRRDKSHLYYSLADDHVRDLVRNMMAHAAESHAHND